MLAGTKPMAMFSDPFYVSDMCYLFFSLPGEEWRMEEALIMSRNLCAGAVIDHDADSARMGELLGYASEDIEAFLRH